MVVAIAESLSSYIPMMTVPSFEIGNKIIAELKGICPDEVFTLVSGGNYSDVQPYTNWDWKFMH
jgi:hypothetical protein